MADYSTRTRPLPLILLACLALAISVLMAAPSQANAQTLDLGVDLGSGFTLEVDGIRVDQTGIKEQGLEAVIYWRRDALNDTNVKWFGVTMREYLQAEGISEADYLNPSWSNEAERVCIQRAFETTISWDHIRPNNDSCFMAEYPVGWSNGEVIARGPSYISDAIDLWAYEKDAYVNETGDQTGHYEFLINPSITHYGFAIINHCSVGHSYVNSVDSSATGINGTFSMRFNAPIDWIAQYGLVGGTESICVGEQKQLEAYLDYKSGNYRVIGTWESSDPSVVSVTEDGLATGVSSGTCTIALTCTDENGVSDGGYFDIRSGVSAMYRLYNPNSGEHFYTAKENERDAVAEAGWVYEGVGWYAPQSSSTPVYRLYNKYAGDHHYTTSASERDALVKVGWNYEGVGWYSDDAKTVALYRQYNPNARTGTHNYTIDKSENDALVKIGWKAEGIGWYGI